MRHETILGLILIGLGAGILAGVATAHAGYLADSSVKYAYPQTLQIYGTRGNPGRPKLSATGNQRSREVEEIKRYVCDPRFKWSCQKILKIIACESSFRPTVISKTGDGGLLQIAPVHGIPMSRLLDWRDNIDIGYQLFLKRGYQPWASSIKCHGIR